MRVLLLSISPNQSGNRQRTDYLADALKLAGHEPFIVRWRRWKDASLAVGDGEFAIRLLPTGARFLRNRTPIWNQWMVKLLIARLIKEHHIDLVIWPNNWFAIGFPPKRLAVPIVIDYFDLLEKGMESKYLKDRVVLCTSRELQVQAEQWTAHAWWIPTPIDVSKFKYQRDEAKRLIGIHPETRVVSLIGLTASPTLYFIDAIDNLNTDDVVCLLVGQGELLDSIYQRMKIMKHPDRIRIVGKVPYHEVPLYFCATDVGMYPGEDIDYFHSACPIKILEYSASGAAVVSNDLRELRHWDFPNIVLTDTTSEGFRSGLEEGFDLKFTLPDLTAFSLTEVSRNLNSLLESMYAYNNPASNVLKATTL